MDLFALCPKLTCFHKERTCLHVNALQQKLAFASVAFSGGESPWVFTLLAVSHLVWKAVCKSVTFEPWLTMQRQDHTAGTWLAFRTSNVKPIIFFRKFYQLLNVWCYFNYCFVTFSFRITLFYLGISFEREALLPLLGTYPLLHFFSNTCCIWHSRKALTRPRHGC